jgi:hypothetical protein
LIHKFSAFPWMALMKDAKVPGWDHSRPDWPFFTEDAQGRIFLTDRQQRRIWIYDEDLDYLGGIDTGDVTPVCAAADASGALFVTDDQKAAVFKVGPVAPGAMHGDLEWYPDPFYFPPASDVRLLDFKAPSSGIVDDFVERAEFIDQQDHAVQEEAFDALDAQTAAWRSGQTTFNNGDSKLFNFYTAVSTNCHFYQRDLPESRYLGFLAKADRWLAKSPLSVTARLLKAQLMIDYGWQARGGGMAAQVEKDGWKLFGERLGTAWSILDSLKDDPAALADPMYYVMRMHAGYGLSKGPDEITRWYTLGHKACPQTWELAATYSDGIAYKWGGEDRLPGFFGQLLKADPVAALYVASYDGDNSYGSDLPANGGPWDKFMPDRESYWVALAGAAKAALALHPGSAMVLSRIGRVAANSGHYSEAAPLLDAAGDRYESMVWRDNDTYFMVKRHCEAEAAKDH